MGERDALVDRSRTRPRQPAVVDEPPPLSYAQRVGDRLRAIRRQKNLSLQDVEAASNQEFKASVLGAYERGERAISVPRLQRLARFYNVPVDQLLPRDLSPEPGRLPQSSPTVDLTERSSHGGVRGTVTIDLTRLDRLQGPEGSMLGRYLNLIQVQRQDFNGRMLTIRRDDLRAIACILDSSVEGAADKLDELGLCLNQSK
jgi:transcriptional regulator with XRE-family HTH domain